MQEELKELMQNRFEKKFKKYSNKMCTSPYTIVLDLDETLIHCPRNSLTKQNRLAFEKNGIMVFELGNGVPVLLRPGFHEFLQAITANFDYIFVFTAATKLYAKEVVDSIFKGTVVEAVWSREHCYIEKAPNTDEILAVKKLLRGKIHKGFHLDQDNTLIVDDRDDVSEGNVYAGGGNHFVIKPFTGNSNDDELYKLCKYIAVWKKSKLLPVLK